MVKVQSLKGALVDRAFERERMTASFNPFQLRSSFSSLHDDNCNTEIIAFHPMLVMPSMRLNLISLRVVFLEIPVPKTVASLSSIWVKSR
jgi:hypothetical protein